MTAALTDLRASFERDGSEADVDVAMSWLRAAGLHDWFVPAQRWLAAFWAFAVDDPRVMRFCRGVLLETS